MRIRARLLHFAFKLLYERFVLFHELAGRVLYGQAWHARRIACLHLVPADARIVDLGAGEGLLVAEALRRGRLIRGIEPSEAMRTSALRRGVRLVNGSSFDLPLAPRSVDAFVVTYPGPWILASETWSELERVSTPGARVVILLGGTYRAGPWSTLRQLLTRVTYGQRQEQLDCELPAAVRAGFHVSVEWLADPWGEMLVVCARR